MPLYDYRCEKCGEVFEVRQSFSDPILTVHEGCGGEVKRLISAPALQFKGTGWYVTDYGRGGKSPATNGKSEGGKSEGGKSEGGKSESGKTETKTETKSEKKAESKSESKPAPAKSSSTD
jgi:putative FmdB family regulatory protein